MPRGRPKADKPKIQRDCTPPTCPRWITAKEAREEWKYAVEQLRALGVIHKADRAMLELYVTQVLVLRKCERELQTRGPFNEKGEIMPAARLFRDVTAKLRGICTELGLSPNSRGWTRTVEEPERKAETETQEFLNARFPREAV